MRIGRQLNMLLLALGAMFLQQTFAALGKSLPPVIAPAIVADLRLDPTWLGIYVALAASASLVFQLGCGSFIVRYGALRTSQVALAMLALGLVAASAGPLAPWCMGRAAIPLWVGWCRGDPSSIQGRPFCLSKPTRTAGIASRSSDTG